MDRNELIAELRKGIEIIKMQRIVRTWHGPFFDKWVRMMAIENGKDDEI